MLSLHMVIPNSNMNANNGSISLNNSNKMCRVYQTFIEAYTVNKEKRKIQTVLRQQQCLQDSNNEIKIERVELRI